MMHYRSAAHALLLTGLLALTGVALASSSPKPETGAAWTRQVTPFLQKHCVRCHGSTRAKAGVRVDDLGSNLLDADTRERWEEIAAQLIGRRMPPADQPGPTRPAVNAVIDQIGKAIAASGRKPESTLLVRRMNREEYRNTLVDLVGVEPDLSGFPLDPPAGGFSNNRRSLVVSPLHIELFTAFARAALDRALVEGQRPEVIRWRFQPEEGSGDDHRIDLPVNQHPIVHGGDNRKQDGFTIFDGGPHGEPNVRDFRVPRPGRYVIRIRAGGRVPAREDVVRVAERYLRGRRDEAIAKNPGEAKFQNGEYEIFLRHFRTDPMYDYAPPRFRLGLVEGARTRQLGEIDIDAPAAAAKVYEFPVTLSREPLDVRLMWAYPLPRTLENFWMRENADFPRPEIWLDWVEIEGPLYDAWPPSSHTAILFPAPAGSDERSHVREVLRRFMTRAYRGPVTAEEVEQKLALFDRRRKESRSLVEAIKAPLVAVLISPRFLYLAGSAADAASGADDALAARLAYFLWSTMPDRRLTEVAASGQLRQREVLQREATRMLADPRARALSENFAAEWLGLREVGSNPPIADYFPGYDRHLEVSMVAEAKAFFEEVLRNDRSVLDFIRADYVMLNERLARFYGIAGVKGDALRRVSVAPSSHRGGLLSLGAMLTLTSNGTRTSPVKRGVWVLRNMLGADPGLPVDNAGEIKTKVPGVDKATVRQRLQLHRTAPQCARCHNEIDPLGLALENYDGSGAWRDREGFGYKGRVEPNDPPIDASALLADGAKVSGVVGLQDELLRRADEFRRCLASKMLSYALGRELGLEDRAAVDAAVEHMKRSGDTLKSLAIFIVTSEAFRGS